MSTDEHNEDEPTPELRREVLERLAEFSTRTLHPIIEENPDLKRRYVAQVRARLGLDALVAENERPPPRYKHFLSTLRAAWEWEMNYLRHPLCTLREEWRALRDEDWEDWKEIRAQQRAVNQIAKSHIRDWWKMQGDDPWDWARKRFLDRRRILDKHSDLSEVLKEALEVGSREWWVKQTARPDEDGPIKPPANE